jgi:hypothetical protein
MIPNGYACSVQQSPIATSLLGKVRRLISVSLQLLW